MVTIIGAGPIGLATGIELKRRGIEHRIVDRGSLVHSIYNYPVNMTFFSTLDRLEIGNVPFISHGSKPTRAEALEYYRRAAEHHELNIHLYEEVTGLEGEDGDFTVITDKESYPSEKVVLATGFYGVPNMMSIPGEELPKVTHYYKEPHPYAWQKVLVIGAGNSAVDVALETWRAGADVTMAVREEAIEETVKYWVRQEIESRLNAGEIKGYFYTEVSGIREKEVDLLSPDGPLTIENDFVLAMTGYVPHFDLMSSMGIELSQDEKKEPVYNRETLETNRRGLYVAGVVCGGMDTRSLFIENTRVHASQIADDIKNKLAANVV